MTCRWLMHLYARRASCLAIYFKDLAIVPLYVRECRQPPCPDHLCSGTCNDSFASAGRTLPLEIMPAGSFDPLYHTHLDVSSGELPVLPLSIYGALAMAHPPDGLDGDSSASEFFFYKFAPQSSGLAGLSFDEGNFGVFGYVTQVRLASDQTLSLDRRWKHLDTAIIIVQSC